MKTGAEIVDIFEDECRSPEAIYKIVHKHWPTIRDALMAYEPKSAWQPISTAPMTSGAYLVWCPERWNIYIVTWSEPDNSWRHFGPAPVLLAEVPSHWMPLPPQPASPKSALRTILDRLSAWPQSAEILTTSEIAEAREELVTLEMSQANVVK